MSMATQGITAASLRCADADAAGGSATISGDSASSVLSSARSHRISRQRVARQRREALLSSAYQTIERLEARVLFLVATINQIGALSADNDTTSAATKVRSQDSSAGVAGTDGFFDISEPDFFQETSIQTDLTLPVDVSAGPCNVLYGPVEAVVTGFSDLAYTRLHAHAACHSRIAEFLSDIEELPRGDGPFVASAQDAADILEFDFSVFHDLTMEANFHLANLSTAVHTFTESNKTEFQIEPADLKHRTDFEDGTLCPFDSPSVSYIVDSGPSFDFLHASESDASGQAQHTNPVADLREDDFGEADAIFASQPDLPGPSDGPAGRSYIIPPRTSTYICNSIKEVEVFHLQEGLKLHDADVRRRIRSLSDIDECSDYEFWIRSHLQHPHQWSSQDFAKFRRCTDMVKVIQTILGDDLFQQILEAPSNSETADISSLRCDSSPTSDCAQRFQCSSLCPIRSTTTNADAQSSHIESDT